VQIVDDKVETCKKQIKHFKKQMKLNDEDLQLIAGEVALKARINTLT
jgi:hypothetical protein